MTELDMTLLVAYIVGIFVWMLVEKRFFPYEEGEYTIEFDGAHEITPDMHKDRSICRSILWPLCLAFIIVMLPLVALEKIYDYFNF